MLSVTLSTVLIAAGFAMRSEAVNRVPVKIYAMSGCPCSGQFAYDFYHTIWSDEEMRASIDFSQAFAATPHRKDNSTTCFHGKKECEFEKWLVCAQKLFGEEDTLTWEVCVDGTCDGDYAEMSPCKTQYSNPSNLTLMRSCAPKSFDFEKLQSCASSSEGSDLLFADATRFDKSYGLQGLPVVEVNNKVVSSFFACHVHMDKVVSAICDAIPPGGKRPSMCAAEKKLTVGSQCDASSMIKRHEGSRSCVYTDTTGHKTIGVGFNLDQSGARSVCESAGIDYDSVYSGATCLTDTQINALLAYSMKQAESSAAADVSSYDSLCCNVQNVVTDMAFNLGQAGLAEFRNTISNINSGNWAAAASGMRASLWCSQVGSRCTEDAGDMEKGCGPSPSPSPPSPSPSPPSPSPSPSSNCKSCVENGGGKACVSRCEQCGSSCTSCIENGGGMACASRCC